MEKMQTSLDSNEMEDKQIQKACKYTKLGPYWND